ASTEDIDCTEEIGLELIADIVLVLILTCADNAVARAIGDDVDAAPMGDGSLNHVFDRGAYADVAEEREGAVWIGSKGGMSRDECVFTALTDCGDEIMMRQGGFGYRSSDIACGSKDLEMLIEDR
ncbi:MAG: hypothetical protein LQ337_007609, partial [Flavoplaca oasis]